MKTKGAKKKPKTIGKLLANCQVHFNKFIRDRDQGLPCISCGEYKVLQAGHFFAICGYKSLRLDEKNVHGECEYCNCRDQSHLIGYSDNIESRIGLDELLLLKERAAEYKRGGFKWNRAEIIELTTYYREINKLNA